MAMNHSGKCRKRARRQLLCSANGADYQSAEGAKYNSQGQARSASPLVKAPKKARRGLKGRNNYPALFRAGLLILIFGYQRRRASRLPLAIISRAVGAAIYLFAT